MAAFDEQLFVGTWHIVASNFPMWVAGGRTQPRFHYEQLEPGRLSDRVTYVRRGRERQILGIDTRLPGDMPAYRWRGAGVLRLLRSDWQVSQWDPGYAWAVITFAKSLVTPAGMDLIARSPGNELEKQSRELGLKML